jgi:glycosyltransferase involved in cell wall biosynthesis
MSTIEMPNSSSPPAPKRLALVITELEPGGAERCLVEIATGLNRTRFSPIVVSLAPPPGAAEKQILVERLKSAGVPTHFLGFAKAWDYFAAVRQLADLFQAADVEFVQTFLFHANVVGARAALMAHVPHVLAGIRVADPRPWRTYIERWATSGAGRLVCVSQSVAEFCRRRGFAAEKLVVIPNGVDSSRWQALKQSNANPLGVSERRRSIVFVGRLDKQKGLDRFFEELPKIFDLLPQHNLVLVGDGPQRASLERKASRLGLASRVHFCGWQPDAAPFIATADILVLPSRWEGMPNVVLEAMAAGKPVVATQAEGTVELLGIGALEQTVAVGDWQGFRERIIEMGQNPAIVAELGQRNLSRAEQFSVSTMVQRYERLYAAVAGS